LSDSVSDAGVLQIRRTRKADPSGDMPLLGCCRGKSAFLLSHVSQIFEEGWLPSCRYMPINEFKQNVIDAVDVSRRPLRRSNVRLLDQLLLRPSSERSL
jgi:hypothetical protein